MAPRSTIAEAWRATASDAAASMACRERARDHRHAGLSERGDRGTDLLRVEAAAARPPGTAPTRGARTARRNATRCRGRTPAPRSNSSSISPSGTPSWCNQRADVEKAEVDLDVVAVGVRPADQAEILEAAPASAASVRSSGNRRSSSARAIRLPAGASPEHALDAEERAEVAAGFPRLSASSRIAASENPQRLEVGDQPQPSARCVSS